MENEKYKDIKELKWRDIIRVTCKTTGIIFAVLILLILSIISELSQIEVQFEKDTVIFEVEENSIVDYTTFLNPPEEYTVLETMDIDLRRQIAGYMLMKNYRLKSGQQHFYRSDTFESCIEELDFVSIGIGSY